MSEEHGWYDLPWQRLVNWIRCVECGEAFRTEGDRILNCANFQQHAMNVFSVAHANCEEES